MSILIETERLILRDVLEGDLEGFYELDSNPEVHRYLGNKPVKDKEKLKAVIAFIREQYRENGIGRWAIIEKSSNEFVGWTGLKLNREKTNNHIDFYDLGYRLIERFWGKGYATESGIASLDYGFRQLNLDEIYASAHIENMASNKILSKLGFKLMENYLYEEELNNWYRLNKNEWINR